MEQMQLPLTGVTPRACSFTGHRSIVSAHRPALPALLDRAIAYAYGQGCRTFYTGGAVGFDTEAARRVLLFRLSHPDARLCLLLPCPEQAQRWDGAQQDRYGYILSSADGVEYVSDCYTDDCLRRRNAALAERGDILIAYVGRSASGSAQTLRMARRLGKPVFNLYPALEGNV